MADSFHEDLRKLVAAEEGRDLRALLERVESFVSGFEGDETQEGIDELLADVRAEIAKIPTLRDLVEDGTIVVGWDMGAPEGDRSVEVRIPISAEEEEIDANFEEWLSRIPRAHSDPNIAELPEVRGTSTIGDRRPCPCGRMTVNDCLGECGVNS